MAQLSLYEHIYLAYMWPGNLFISLHCHKQWVYYPFKYNLIAMGGIMADMGGSLNVKYGSSMMVVQIIKVNQSTR